MPQLANELMDGFQREEGGTLSVGDSGEDVAKGCWVVGAVI